VQFLRIGAVHYADDGAQYRIYDIASVEISHSLLPNCSSIVGFGFHSSLNPPPDPVPEKQQQQQQQQQELFLLISKSCYTNKGFKSPTSWA
jgi:hypothetical protein